MKIDRTSSSFKQWISLGSVLLTFVTLLIYFNFDRITCSGVYGNIHCMANHPFTFQLIDQAGNSILNQSIDKTAEAPCADLAFTADTLTVVMAVVPNNVHYSEASAELVDSILLKQPECFLEASARLKQNVRLELNYVLDTIENFEFLKSNGRQSLRRFRLSKQFAKSLRDFRVGK